MFIGHFALGFAAKKITPRTNLATLFVAAQLADILWPIFVALGIEEVAIVPGVTKATPLDFVSYPWSHSLLMLVIWGWIFGGLYLARTRNVRGALVIGGLVVSHWVLDVIAHRPDMPVYPGGPVFGLGMWNSIPLTHAVEFGLFAIGVAIYDHATHPRDKQGHIGFWILVILLLVAYVASSTSGPPPSVKALWITAMIGTVVTLVIAWWSDKHRVTSIRSKLR